MTQAGNQPGEIAVALRRHATSIRRELARNSSADGTVYDYVEADRSRRQRRRLARKPYVLGPELGPTLIALLEQRFSPGQIELFLAEDGVSARRLYTFIALDRRAGGSLYRLLPRGRRPRRRACRWRRGPIPDRRDISERPAAANTRAEVGHWEADLVEGQGRHSDLLTLRDRRSRYGQILRVPNKESATVTAALIRALQPFRRTFRTLTVDNGGEFAGHKEVAATLGHPGCVFFARPYRAGDKGSLEEFNGRLRRHHPKGTDFRLVNDRLLAATALRLNLPPLKVTGGKSPLSFLDQLLAPAA